MKNGYTAEHVKKYGKETIARWNADAKRAKSQFDSLHKSGKMHLPSTSPARRDFDLSTGERRASKTAALKKKTK